MVSVNFRQVDMSVIAVWMLSGVPGSSTSFILSPNSRNKKTLSHSDRNLHLLELMAIKPIPGKRFRALLYFLPSEKRVRRRLGHPRLQKAWSAKMIHKMDILASPLSVISPGDLSTVGPGRGLSV
ncbi:sec1 family domain-containing protein 2 [Platysternon megacephalum]|uniref:Sec1 family domain-containing protein 2 n=1 Tax=Platysternon megacephalum TaxID=55544 RepID=A0A4D9F6X2_9SAUR|nr:sec1 family domain-containing protein 2 [Platysternon megacephalum]